MTTVEQIDKSFSIRERLGLYILLLILKIVKPMNWTHEYSKDIEAIQKMTHES